jgi:DNA sulfur modification protein DndC
MPLLEIRNFLSMTQDPEKKRVYREYKRRSGRVDFKSDGSGIISRGPYTLAFCKELLERILKAQQQMKAAKPGFAQDLILPEELQEIRRIWLTERGDWEDSVPKIYRSVTGKDLDWATDDFGMFEAIDKETLESVCNKLGLEGKMVAKLLDVERQHRGMARRASIYQKIDAALNEEWRSEEEIMSEKKRR